jgi:hypothetical protein
VSEAFPLLFIGLFTTFLTHRSLRDQFSDHQSLQVYLNYANREFECAWSDLSTRHRSYARSCQWVVDHLPDGTPKLCEAAITPDGLTNHIRVAGHHLRPQGLSKCKDDDVLCRWGTLNRRCKVAPRRLSPSTFSNHIKRVHLRVSDVVEGRPIVIPGVTIQGTVFKAMDVATDHQYVQNWFFTKLRLVCLCYMYEERARLGENDDVAAGNCEHV